jgi:hypothetical protein
MTHNITPALTERATPITRLHPHPHNAATGKPHDFTLGREAVG